MRPGFREMMAVALRKGVDVVLAESLDRFSRDQEDTAGLFKRLMFAGVNIVTLAEGDISFLHMLRSARPRHVHQQSDDSTPRGRDPRA